jgi:hypothetical protein
LEHLIKTVQELSGSLREDKAHQLPGSSYGPKNKDVWAFKTVSPADRVFLPLYNQTLTSRYPITQQLLLTSPPLVTRAVPLVFKRLGYSNSRSLHPPSMANVCLSLVTFLALPFDVQIEILSWLSTPEDLLCLCQAHCLLRNLLTQRCFDFVWRNLRRSYTISVTRVVHRSKGCLLWREVHSSSISMPPKPSFMDELTFAQLTFGKASLEVCAASL